MIFIKRTKNLIYKTNNFVEHEQISKANNFVFAGVLAGHDNRVSCLGITEDGMAVWTP